MKGRLSGRVAIVTGGGRGIGAATARFLAEEGAKVAVVSRTEGEVRASAEAIERAAGPGSALAIAADVAGEAAVARVFDETIERFGDFHCLVNNAAIFEAGEVERLEAEVWDRVMAVNVRSVFLASREAFRRLRALGHGGSIVNVSSLGGVQGTQKFPGFLAYTTSKAAVVGMTECLAAEGRPLGIRVNCVAPGAVETKMLREAAPFLKTETLPEHVARVIAFYCDDAESAHVTGTTLPIHSNL